MNDKISVEGYSNLKRDAITGAILNTDDCEYENYINMKKIKDQEKQKLDSAIEEISALKSELSEIKNLILNLGKNNGTV